MRRARSWPLWVFLGWTVFVWAGRIRNGGSVLLAASFLVHQHPVAFKIVHTVLAVVSIALAISAQRHVQRERQATTAAARL